MYLEARLHKKAILRFRMKNIQFQDLTRKEKGSRTSASTLGKKTIFCCLGSNGAILCQESGLVDLFAPLFNTAFCCELHECLLLPAFNPPFLCRALVITTLILDASLLGGLLH